ncbi:MAG: DUF6468 domain-containing protein [Pseudomonadota bacterium]|nr:DUF6468 domain-containing protein [Pseudomonadota bacterium]
MTFATFTNIIVILVGGAVLVQSVRIMRSFQAVKNGGLKEMVAALDLATAQARSVLADLKETLRTEGAANARTVAQGENVRDELTVMVGIANAAAERMLEAVQTNNRAQLADLPQDRPEREVVARKPAGGKRSRARAADRKAVAEAR